MLGASHFQKEWSENIVFWVTYSKNKIFDYKLTTLLIFDGLVQTNKIKLQLVLVLMTSWLWPCIYILVHTYTTGMTTSWLTYGYKWLNKCLLNETTLHRLVWLTTNCKIFYSPHKAWLTGWLADLQLTYTGWIWTTDWLTLKTHILT